MAQSSGRVEDSMARTGREKAGGAHDGTQLCSAGNAGDAGKQVSVHISSILQIAMSSSTPALPRSHSGYYTVIQELM